MEIKLKVGIVIVNKNNQVLLIKEKIKKKPIALWNIIKGTCDYEETIFETAKRECKEEASLDVNLTNSLGVNISKEASGIRVQFNFLAQSENMIAKIAPKEEQIARDEIIEEIKWFSKEEISKMKHGEFISKRAFNLLQNYMAGKIFPLEVYSQVEK